MRVGIQILNYNGMRWLPGVLESLERHGEPGQRLYVVDNGSTDGSLDYVSREHPEVVIVRHGSNLGYGGAYNRSIPLAFADGCDWVCLQNSDTLVSPGWLRPLAKAAEDATIGVMGPVFLKWDGDEPNYYMQGRCRDVIPFMHDATHPPVDRDWIEGSCFLVRRECYEAIGGFDSLFFMYWEDADDGSTEPLDEVGEQFRQRQPNLRHLHQPNQGPAAARNLGIAQAAAAIVLFLDSDVLPEVDVVRSLTEALERDPRLEGAEARLLPTGGKASPVWEAPRSDAGGHYHTAGIAYRRPTLLAVGGLDEAFSRAACEDVELTVRVQRHGPIGFVPEAVVRHPRRWRKMASAWRARRNCRFVQILACRNGFVAWPGNTTRWPRLETALCAAVKLPIGRVMAALRSLGRTPVDSIVAIGLAMVDTAAGVSMVPTILFGSVPLRRSRFICDDHPSA